ncbi:dihydroorotate dehydrogenase [Luminiphilus syltensis NOR5-1B]|uniref:Dihydroorotate dehydrogenase n=1 Tax=Luminiphilus syltensis NOR5-1B TaxID=565045 RepID=B8KSX8_9GAMM|nr:tRNA-dihydrouridine synthase [Luminiphilus syltensis]EED35777.1 dihydroorotate dehydrogenase [Luminiphilus syltensis NOR5-1B]
MTTEFLGKRISGPFTIPSGIVSTAPSIIQRLLRDCPQIGVITTKSIGPTPRAGNREPIYSQYAPGCFVNAVGLTNPGAEAALAGLRKLTVPEDRFLLVSIFGGSVEEFVAVATLLAPVADGLELNLSCPHAKGYGMAMGQDPDMVAEVVAAVKAAVAIPVVPKLTPNASDIAAIGRAAVDAGADALCAINTVGPGLTSSHGHPVLSNEVGGMSGKGVLPIALKCIRELRAVTEVPIIGCGGLSTAEDCRAAMTAGADIVGIGSALTGLNTATLIDYFAALESDLTEKTATAEGYVRYDVDMAFHSFEVVSNKPVCDDITVLTLDGGIDIRAGEYVFVWIPGVGEKPFSCLTDKPLRLAAIDVGEFTHATYGLQQGDEVFIRGPYGEAVSPPGDAHIVCVAGGTGLAAVYQLARDFGSAEAPAQIFAGARSADRLYFLEECRAIAEVTVATDDGSEGFRGRVTDALDDYLAALPADVLSRTVFYNCGPEPMIHAAHAVQQRYCADEQIHSAIDYTTKCGVGICGACASPDGRRICIDGPFIDIEAPILNG